MTLENTSNHAPRCLSLLVGKEFEALHRAGMMCCKRPGACPPSAALQALAGGHQVWLNVAWSFFVRQDLHDYQDYFFAFSVSRRNWENAIHLPPAIAFPQARRAGRRR